MDRPITRHQHNDVSLSQRPRHPHSQMPKTIDRPLSIIMIDIVMRGLPAREADSPLQGSFSLAGYPLRSAISAEPWGALSCVSAGFFPGHCMRLPSSNGKTIRMVFQSSSNSAERARLRVVGLAYSATSGLIGAVE
ncbi:hypothetical protein AB9X41_11460 [Ralstonia solanacearum]|uniref:hypothetical protein n=1 Tax=Ralstonia solanacearum TaxID=305 RepID=UPI0035172C77